MTKSVLVIGSRYFGTKNDPKVVASKLSDSGVAAKLVYWEDLEFDISTGSVRVSVDGADILSSSPDLVLAFGWYKNGKQAIYRDIAYSLALVLDSRGVEYWNQEMGFQRSTTKLSTMVQLALADLPVPETAFCLQLEKVLNRFNQPFIAKAAAASRGDSNFLVGSSLGLVSLRQLDVYFIVQKYLENDHDLRVICFNGEPQLVLKRSRDVKAETHLNNTSKGGRSEWISLEKVDSRILTFVSKISKITGRDMAGVDLIPDKISPYGYSCLEVNAIPQLTSGVDARLKVESLIRSIKNR